jgi:hypothetical protein
LEPLKNVLECIGWNHEKKISLLSFFWVNYGIFRQCSQGQQKWVC